MASTMNGLFLVVCSLAAFASVGRACNVAVCASIVAKCTAMTACVRDSVDVARRKECFGCLHVLYDECCSCVGMCPKPNEVVNALSMESLVEDLPDSVTTLFNFYVTKPDLQEQWELLTFPIKIDIKALKPNIRKEIKLLQINSAQEVDPIKDTVTVICTVVYMNNCLSPEKCKAQCSSINSISYRWFHDGCCECVGDRCMNYGLNQSRCKQCPLKGAKDPAIIEANYGDEDDNDDVGGQCYVL